MIRILTTTRSPHRKVDAVRSTPTPRNRNRRCRRLGPLLLGVLLLMSGPFVQAHKGLSFQVTLKKPDGTYPSVSGLNVTLQILDPVTDCVLREEVHSGVSISNGYLHLVLGSTSATTPAGRNPSPLLDIPQVFDNGVSRAGLNCVDVNNTIVSSGQTYTPTANAVRKLRLRATIDGDPIVADFSMRAVAFAVNAENLDGKTAGAFLQTSVATTQANVESVFLRYSVLDAILNGTFAGNASTATALAAAPGTCPAGQYMNAMTASGAITCGTPAAGGGTVTGVTSANSYLSVAAGTTAPVLTVNVGAASGTVAAGDDARFTDARAPNGTAGGDLSGSYPNPSVAKVSGKAVTLTSPAAGDILTYDGTKFVNSPPATAVDATKLPLAGGTMTGAIDMGSQNLTSTGFITMSANKNLHLSNNASDPTGLGTSDKGKIWFNSTTGEVKYWNGSASQPLGVAGSGLQTFNTQTGTSQTLAIGTSGTAPGWSSATNVHTLNIPLASGASVTAGLISKTDYDSFAGKLDASSTFAGDVTGTPGTTSVDKIKGKAVTPAAYAAGQTLRYDGTQWVNAVLGFSDLGSKPTTLAGYGITDAQSTTLANGKIIVGNASNVAAAVTMSGDATLSNAGALTLATVPVSKGGTGLTTLTGDKLLTTSGAGSVQTSSCGLNQVISFTAGGAITCANVSALVSDFTNGGNSFGAAATLGTKDAFDLNFITGASPRMTILSDGRVGIGTTAPTYAFEVDKAFGTLPAGTSLLMNFATTGSGIAAGTSNLKTLAINLDTDGANSLVGSNALELTSQNYASAGTLGSQVGISNGLYLRGAGDINAAYGYRSYVEFGAGSTGGITGQLRHFEARSPNLIGTGTLVQATGLYVEDQKVTGVTTGYGIYQNGTADKNYFGGKVGLGTTTPAARLDLTDTSTTTSAIIVPRAGTFTGTNVNGMIRYNTASTLFEFRQNGAWVNFTTVSDGRLKKNVAPITNGLEIVNQLSPVTYDWDAANPKAASFPVKHQVGFIAQEVEKILPEVVNQGEDGYRSLEYGKMVSVVVAAVKELYQTIQRSELENRLRDQRLAMALEQNEKLRRENLEISARLEKVEARLSRRPANDP